MADNVEKGNRVAVSLLVLVNVVLLVGGVLLYGWIF